MNTSSKIGVIGLGLVGTAIAKRLSSAGYTPIGFDVRPEAREAFASLGFEVTPSLVDMGQSVDCVLLAVFETKDVVSVIESANGLLSGGSVRMIRTLIDCSTGEPEALQALALRLIARGVDFIEAPLSGSSEQIANGEATMLLGGDDVTIHRCARVLNAISPKRIHVGTAGMGANAKLATNLVLGLNRTALAEGMVFAQTLGIDAAKFLDLVLQTPARSGAAEAKGQMMVDSNFAPQSRIRQHLKDVEIMMTAAGQAGQKLPLSEAHAVLMRAAVAAGDGDLDNAAIIQQIQREKSKEK
jgi:3-hydroxyisobutyrate dehydrogenase-like beta-hydroxyacid dehydrogenase